MSASVLSFLALLMKPSRLHPKIHPQKEQVLSLVRVWDLLQGTFLSFLSNKLYICVTQWSLRLRAYTPYPSIIRDCAPLLTNKRLTCLFLSCVVVSIVRYTFRLKNPRKATGPDFIPLKFIKFASNVIDSHLYDIIIKDLNKNKYSEEP